MPRPHVVNAYRTEEVNLQPHGNTISVTTLAENPFESEGEIEIVTQESGGMSGPDPRMTSAGQRGVNRGMWGSRRRRASAQRRVLGLSPVAVARLNAYDKGVHGLGADPVLPSWVPGADAAQQMKAAQDAKDAEANRQAWEATKQITGALAQTGAQIYSQQLQAKTASAGARAADAAARAAQAQAAAAMAAGRQVPQKSNKGLILGVGIAGLAVIALGAFLIMRKRK